MANVRSTGRMTLRGDIERKREKERERETHTMR